MNSRSIGPPLSSKSSTAHRPVVDWRFGFTVTRTRSFPGERRKLRIRQRIRHTRKRHRLGQPPGLRIHRIAGQIACDDTRSTQFAKREIFRGPVELIVTLHHARVAIPEVSGEQGHRLRPRLAAIHALQQKQVVIAHLRAALVREQIQCSAVHKRCCGVVRQIGGLLPRLAAVTAAQNVRDALRRPTLLAPLLTRHHRHDGNERAVIHPHKARSFDVALSIRIVKHDAVILHERFCLGVNEHRR